MGEKGNKENGRDDENPNQEIAKGKDKVEPSTAEAHTGTCTMSSNYRNRLSYWVLIGIIPRARTWKYRHGEIKNSFLPSPISTSEISSSSLPRKVCPALPAQPTDIFDRLKQETDICLTISNAQRPKRLELQHFTPFSVMLGKVFSGLSTSICERRTAWVGYQGRSPGPMTSYIFFH